MTAMKYAYRQLRDENAERFRDVKDKQPLARCVIKSMEDIRPGAQREIAALVDLIMADDDLHARLRTVVGLTWALQKYMNGSLV